ncbi:UNVERIFIED_CONTAM: hypothetical protein FKN15_015483 [Acipenser sinensis]
MKVRSQEEAEMTPPPGCVGRSEWSRLREMVVAIRGKEQERDGCSESRVPQRSSRQRQLVQSSNGHANDGTSRETKGGVTSSKWMQSCDAQGEQHRSQNGGLDRSKAQWRQNRNQDGQETHYRQQSPHHSVAVRRYGQSASFCRAI